MFNLIKFAFTNIWGFLILASILGIIALSFIPRTKKITREICFWIVLILGFAAPSFELCTSICAEVFFDPLPNLLSVILFFLIPVFMLINRIILFLPAKRINRIISIYANVLALSISFVFTLIFIQILPVSIITCMFYGIGFFGLTPFLLFIFSIWLVKQNGIITRGAI